MTCCVGFHRASRAVTWRVGKGLWELACFVVDKEMGQMMI